MPAITSGKVLVTGANGYIAVWVVKSFLDQGFSVRGTVRSESKATHLRSLFKTFGDRFEVVIVEDITKVRTHPSPKQDVRHGSVSGGNMLVEEGFCYLCVLHDFR